MIRDYKSKKKTTKISLPFILAGNSLASSDVSFSIQSSFEVESVRSDA